MTATQDPAADGVAPVSRRRGRPRPALPVAGRGTQTSPPLSPPAEGTRTPAEGARVADRAPSAGYIKPRSSQGAVTLTATAHCHRCDWTAGPGNPAVVDKAAEKHVAVGHPTAVVAEPVRGAA